jgi:hypothetical protein
MIPIHRGRAKANVKAIWLVAVKIKGSKPGTLFSIININKPTQIINL